MKPYIVLGMYYPVKLPADKWNPKPGWRAWKTGEDLCELTASKGLKPLYDPVHPAQTWPSWSNTKLHAEVKKWTPEHPGGEAWHYDGDTTPGSQTNCALVLWASNTPTLIKFNNKEKIYQPEPYEVVIFHNLHCHHRRPSKAPEDRFLFRQRVEVTLELP